MLDASFKDSFEQSNRTMFLVRQILGAALFRTANLYEDMYLNADLILDSPRGPVNVSVRIRTNGWYEPKYKHEFTLCCHRHYGGDAEYQKIMGTGEDGKTHGDYFLYGFEDETGSKLTDWFVGDLSIFREWAADLRYDRTSDDDPHLGNLKIDDEVVGCSKKVRRQNKYTGERYYDYMYVFDRREIPGFVIADSDHWPPPAGQ